MRKLSYLVVAAILLVGVLAPLLANDVPLIASVDGEMRFPAFASYVGDVDPGPGGRTWREWWLELPDRSDDWAVMPPIVHDGLPR